MDLSAERDPLDRLKSWWLDEADRMLDMGFIETSRKSWRLLPANARTCCFSLPPCKSASIRQVGATGCCKAVQLQATLKTAAPAGGSR